jgi:hypothetical protein
MMDSMRNALEELMEVICGQPRRSSLQGSPSL